MVLNLDRIHDPDLPLNDLEEHHSNLLNMRCVSTAWNAFLLSRPEYWCAIDIAAPAPESILVRAQHAPLCLYSKQSSETGSLPPFERISSILSGRMTQVRTLRLDKEDVYDLGIRTLRAGCPDLETLELTKATTWEGMDPEFTTENIGDQLPRIRHLTTVGWQPSADASWLQNLQVLILYSPLKVNVNLLRVLSACRDLSRLILHADYGPESAEEMARTPSLIDLPCLREIDLRVDIPADADCILPILRLPSSSQRSLRIEGEMSFGVSSSDISQFLYTHASGLTPPQEAAIEIYCRPNTQPRVVYTVGQAELNFSPGPPTDWAADGFHALIQAVQAHIKDPPLSVTLRDTDARCLSTLKKLADLHITKIGVSGRGVGGSGCEEVLDVLGSTNSVLPFDAAEDEQWPFESLGELIFERANLDLDDLTRLIRIRQRYLQKFSKTWLQKITLVDCQPDHLNLGEAATKLAVMGVMLVISNNNLD
ncbi:hypothetical protein FS837_003787 [Tulasnella sp. UAMH 9824]|nr:hypothetical protein FS837_003787 [Tulasnella sp. UAMH 9824]